MAFALVCAIFAAGSAFAADPIIGTWKLNVEKSKFTSGPAPKSGSRVYSETGGLYTLEGKTVSADGKEATLRVQYRNGEEMKVTAESAYDAIMAKKVDEKTWDFVLKSKGAVVGQVHRVVSADGKKLSVHNTGVMANGAKGDDQLEYEKQ
jgi:hypothetical protein